MPARRRDLSFGSFLRNSLRRTGQLASAWRHGGLARALAIQSERRAHGFSTRSLTYAWPKRMNLREREGLPARVHYLLPHLLTAQSFGGIATILHYALRDARAGRNVHLVLHDAGGELRNVPVIARVEASEWEELKSRVTLTRFDHAQKICLDVGPQDEFVATAWWTKLALDGAQVPAERLTYFIQDFEVLFYDEADPVEAQLAKLARSSYDRRCHAKINSAFLADYLEQRGIWPADATFRRDVFAPFIDETLFREDAGTPKQRQIFVYARPDVARNRFDICVDALRRAAPSIPPSWRILGLGTLKADVDLGAGHCLEAMGKLSLAEYAALLQATPLGLCLMESPHPSYPPLELAACGGLVVCNRYANKDYAQLGKRFLCADLNAAELAQKLELAVKFVDPFI